jgi:hypothetical protein
MNEQQKRAVLTTPTAFNSSELCQFIIDGEFTIEDFIAAGRLPKAKEREIRELLDKAGAEDKLWEEAQSSHTIEGYNLYINSYPDGKYIHIASGKIKILSEEKAWKECMDKYNNANNANNMMRQAIDSFLNFQTRYPKGIHYDAADGNITELKFKFARWKQNEIENMRRNPVKYNRKMFEQWFADKTFEHSDLIEAGLITEEKLKLYLDPPDIFMPEHEWGEIEKLPEDATDVYFFGIPRSGKSCVIAGMLYQADNAGILNPDITNGKGFRYLNELEKSVMLGYVPPSTPIDKMNYIAFGLRGSRYTHPISLIEMSGEYVISIIDSIYRGDNSMEGTNLMRCLGNNNRKTLFFVVDYTANYDYETAAKATTQSNALIGILNFLEQKKVLSNTVSLQIIVTKSDMMPKGDKTEMARAFLKQNYRAFVNIAGELCKKYKINKRQNYEPILVPFTLGKFMLGNTYEYDNRSSIELIENLLEVTPIRSNGQSIWDRVFRNGNNSDNE